MTIPVRTHELFLIENSVIFWRFLVIKDEMGWKCKNMNGSPPEFKHYFIDLLWNSGFWLAMTFLSTNIQDFSEFLIHINFPEAKSSEKSSCARKDCTFHIFETVEVCRKCKLIRYWLSSTKFWCTTNNLTVVV